MKRIDQETVRRILDSANIVEVVSDFVSLKRRGANYIGLCPFHNERTPSFSVSPSRGYCKCFSCGKGGSPVGFIMELEQMSYGEALRYLARKYNIEIQEHDLTPEEQDRETARESMMAVNEFAQKFFEDSLADTTEGHDVGLAYFRERGINDAMIKRFHLGYAPDSATALYDAATAKGFDAKFLFDTGVCIRNEQGRIYDRFRGRVIYPVHSISGKVVAFGGRTLRSDKKMAKYVNSPESIIYSKSNQLYGLFQAKRSIVDRGKCILVEGYMDVISMHQSGIENVVASSGTSLTEGQIRLIHRFTENVTVIYDSDAAGIKASLRGIDMLLAEGLNVKVLLLPDGDDPDSFAQHHSAQEVEDYLAANETDFIAFKTRILLDEAAGDPVRRADVINDILRSIAVIPDIVKRQVYVAECSRSLNIPEATLGLQLSKIAAMRAEDIEKDRERRAAAQSLEQDASPAQDAPEAQAAMGQSYLRGFERQVLRYVVKYALCEIGLVTDNDSDDDTIEGINVLDYVKSEMSADGLEFNDPLHRRIMDMVTEAAAMWTGDYPEICRKYERLREERMERGLQEIRDTGVSVSAINAREAALREECDRFVRESVDNEALEYVGHTLCSSPDDDVRRLCTELSIDRYQLSKVHTKHTKIESERECLSRLVPRAILEFKCATLEVMLRRLQNELKRITEPGEQFELMVQLKDLKSLHSDFARELGDRTITPRKIN
ncbi:MAG: DNA primase [Muribaculaceae bacterium]|nr:DNA primase [Muribaculaceae bacterium]